MDPEALKERMRADRAGRLSAAGSRRPSAQAAEVDPAAQPGAAPSPPGSICPTSLVQFFFSIDVSFDSAVNANASSAIVQEVMSILVVDV